MLTVLKKTFGGLSGQYLFRQYFFSLFLFSFGMACVYLSSQASGKPMNLAVLPFFIINLLLYPYSRFVYERVIGFIMGNNVFYGEATSMLWFKFITMMLCWLLSIFIAPLGLVYLYFHNSRAAG
jgi:hypothetical protein